MSLQLGALARVPLLEVQGTETYYRSVLVTALMQIERAKFLSGEHAGTLGGRYNSPGSAPTLYLAGSQTLASFEVEQDLLLAGLIQGTPTRLMCGVEVVGAKLLDLTNVVVRNALGIDQHDLVQPGVVRTGLNAAGAPSQTQMLGDAIRQRPDCDGIKVPTALGPVFHPGFPRLHNLVLFQDRNDPVKLRRSGPTLTVVDPTSLVTQLDSMPGA
ncbi:MAG: RES family NAD+ phosphorylase [Myxococcota bacterium]